MNRRENVIQWRKPSYTLKSVRERWENTNDLNDAVDFRIKFNVEKILDGKLLPFEDQIFSLNTRGGNTKKQILSMNSMSVAQVTPISKPMVMAYVDCNSNRRVTFTITLLNGMWNVGIITNNKVSVEKIPNMHITSRCAMKNWYLDTLCTLLRSNVPLVRSLTHIIPLITNTK